MKMIKAMLLLTLLFSTIGCKRIIVLFNGGRISTELFLYQVPTNITQIFSHCDRCIISNPLSPDYRHVAILTYGGYVRLDNKAGKSYDEIDRNSIIFSPDSQRIAYTAKVGNHWIAVVDGIEGKSYDHIQNLVFSPDSKSVAYIADSGGKSIGSTFYGGKWRIVINGREGMLYNDSGLANIEFSPDSRRVVFTMNNIAVLDGVSKELPGNIDYNTDIVFSPDSQRVAYLSHINSKQLVILDGKVGPPFDDNHIIWPNSPIFSSNSQHVAYVAINGNRWKIIIDGKEGKSYDYIESKKSSWLDWDSGLSFSPDSQHYSYRANLDGKECVVVDGIEGKFYDSVDIPHYSQDNKHLMYAATMGGKSFVVIDGKEGKFYDSVDIPIYSPDSRHIAFAAMNAKQWFAIVDGKEENQYDTINNLKFSPDNKHLVYFAKTGEKELLVIDGKEGSRYDEISGCSYKGVIFDSSNVLHYCAGRITKEGTDYYLVNETIN